MHKYSSPALGHMFSLFGPHVLFLNKVVTYTLAFVSVFHPSGNSETNRGSKSAICGYGLVARLAYRAIGSADTAAPHQSHGVGLIGTALSDCVD
jgi:hypothetical protein